MTRGARKSTSALQQQQCRLLNIHEYQVRHKPPGMHRSAALGFLCGQHFLTLLSGTVQELA